MGGKPGNDGRRKTSQHRGVTWDNRSFTRTGRRRSVKKWNATITVNGERKHLGSFESEDEAARAYVTACSRIGRDPAPARSSALRGVSWSKGRQRWVAQIQVDGKGRHLGLFMDEEAAAKAYRQACRELGRDPGP